MVEARLGEIMNNQIGQAQLGSAGDQIPPLEDPAPLVQGERPVQAPTGIAQVDVPGQIVSKETEVRLKYAEEVHQYIREYIRIADQKAAFFFAASAALVAFLEKQGYLAAWISDPRELQPENVAAFVAALFLFISIAACFLVVRPRLAGEASGVIFFNAVANFRSQQSYAEAVAQLTPSDLCEEKLKHAYELARVCRMKYEVLYYALWSGAIGIGATGLLLVCA